MGKLDNKEEEETSDDDLDMMLIIKKELELKKQKRFMCFNNSKQKVKWDLFVMLCACWNCF